MLIKERGQYGIQVSDLLAFFRHVAFITHEHGRLNFDEALLRSCWMQTHIFGLFGKVADLPLMVT